MEYVFECTGEAISRIGKINKILLSRVYERMESKDESNDLFIKQSIIYLVTQFQVFVETILKDFKEKIIDSNISFSQLPECLRFPTIKDRLIKKDWNKFDFSGYNKMKRELGPIPQILLAPESIYVNQSNFKFSTSFPLGKTGKMELFKLLEQIRGADTFFQNFTEDSDLMGLDSLLTARVQCVHYDNRGSQLKADVKRHVNFVVGLVNYIDRELGIELAKIIVI